MQNTTLTLDFRKLSSEELRELRTERRTGPPERTPADEAVIDKILLTLATLGPINIAELHSRVNCSPGNASMFVELEERRFVLKGLDETFSRALIALLREDVLSVWPRDPRFVIDLAVGSGQ